jgi:hypothetical protein
MQPMNDMLTQGINASFWCGSLDLDQNLSGMGRDNPIADDIDLFGIQPTPAKTRLY